MFENHEKDMDLLGVKKILIRDWDGIIFINPFNQFDVSEKWIKSERMKPKIRKKLGRPLSKQDIKNYKKEDRNFRTKTLDNVDAIIKDEKEKDETDYNILKKYLWLREFIKWNHSKSKNKRNPNTNSSKIKFDYIKPIDVK